MKSTIKSIMSNYIYKACALCLSACVVLAVSTASAQSLTTYDKTYDNTYKSGYQSTASHDPVYINSRSVPDVARAHWQIANKYKAERRYELSRQHYLMALAHSNTAALRDTLQKELQVVELLIRTLR